MGLNGRLPTYPVPGFAGKWASPYTDLQLCRKTFVIKQLSQKASKTGHPGQQR